MDGVLRLLGNDCKALVDGVCVCRCVFLALMIKAK